jgi:hypothetical protein
MVPCSGCRCPQADPEAPQAWIREIFFSDRNAKQIAPQECVGQDASDDVRCPVLPSGREGLCIVGADGEVTDAGAVAL